uniref:EB domain-containing protein n=1 Tax=Dracunculus medinensis TaxID=318479 RepID=A0A0N4UMR9_DRAME
LGNICICAIGYFYDGVACKKSGGAQVGEYCSSINQCQPANSQCLGNICTCATGYFYNGVACTKSSPPTRLSCTVVGAQVEFRNGYPVNCLTADCSQGYYCEYNKFYNQGQYICCGELPGTYVKSTQILKDLFKGKIRTYAYTNKPLECSAPTSCNVFTETPYCVFSKRYNQRVCCSTFTC